MAQQDTQEKTGMSSIMSSVKPTVADLPQWIYRGVTVALLGFMIWVVQGVITDTDEAQRERAVIAQSLAVVATKLEAIQEKTGDRFTATEAAEMKAEIDRRITTLAGNNGRQLSDHSARIRELELAMERLKASGDRL